jgi:hypothetical protein
MVKNAGERETMPRDLFGVVLPESTGAPGTQGSYRGGTLAHGDGTGERNPYGSDQPFSPTSETLGQYEDSHPVAGTPTDGTGAGLGRVSTPPHRSAGR